jgi:hypothetical protein
MSTKDWAENEVRNICKKINPDFELGKEDFDYDCSCYESALKAFKSLCDDGHSGYSFGFTKNILIKLMNGLPLSPITEEDFGDSPTGINFPNDGDEDYQCKRMSSLFKTVYKDGTISYSDVSRHYCINIENPSDIYHTKTPIDELFPITLPYSPTVEKYKFYTQTFLTDKRNGDYDTKAFLYVITPEGEKVEVNKFYAEINNEWKEISEEEYNERLNKRIDKINLKVADHLLFTILGNSSTEEISKKRNEAFHNLPELEQEEIENELQQSCLIFNNSEYWKYNTFSVIQNLCTQREAGEYPEPIENIRNLINKILDRIESECLI